MNRLPDDVFPEILAFLQSSDIVSLLTCSKDVATCVRLVGCVSCEESFRKAVPSRDLDSKYASHFAFERIPVSMGAVALRPSLVAYRDRKIRRLISQGLELVREPDAARWLARGRWLTGRSPSLPHLSLTRNLSWDFSLFSFVCNALQWCPMPAIRMYVRSVPMVVLDSRPLPASAQALLCCVLAQTAACKALSLHLLGARRPYWFHEGGDVFLGVPPPVGPDGAMAAAEEFGQSVLHRLSSDRIRWRGLHHFCSSNIGLGLILMAAKPFVSALALSQYTFNEPRPSMDVRLLCRYLTSHATRLSHVNLHGLAFVHGADFVDVLEALCLVRTLVALRLSAIEYAVAAPRDPALVLFQRGAHIPDLRMNNVMRGMGTFPFEALALAPGGPPGSQHQHLGFTRMFLDTGSLRPLLLKLPLLPSLTSLDVAFNGLDGGSLGVLAGALQSPACKLQRLRMASNIITNSMIDSLCTALRRNTALHHLDLSDNVLGTSGGIRLLQAAIHHNQSLRSVKLDSNHIHVQADQLYRVLLLVPGVSNRVSPHRSFLLHVSLRRNPILFHTSKHDEHPYEHGHDKRKHTSESYVLFFRQMFNVRCIF